MIHRLRAMSLALMAALAVTALVASGAQAFEFTSKNTEKSHIHEHTIITAFQTDHPDGSSGAHVFTAGAGFGGITCTTATFEGTSTTGTDTKQVVTPTYGSCKDSFGRTVDVSTNGCTYEFHATSETSATMFTGTSDIVCAAGKSIEVKITSGGSVICTVAIGAQTGVGPIHFENMTKEKPTDITVTPTATNVINTTSGGFFNCGITNGEHKEGTYNGNTTVRGFTTEGKDLDIAVVK